MLLRPILQDYGGQVGSTYAKASAGKHSVDPQSEVDRQRKSRGRSENAGLSDFVVVIVITHGQKVEATF
jgi:hypothetical protein